MKDNPVYHSMQTMLAILATTLMSPLFENHAAERVDFVRHVRPIFEKHCYDCHSGTEQESGLRLDVKDAALKGGDNHGPDIIAGKADESPLIRFVAADADDDSRMPPGDKLSESEIEILTRWINEGAVWPDGVDRVALEDKRDHWSFKPLAVAADAQSLDNFIALKLKEHGLEFTTEADPVTWLRRVTFDLTGLPPTPDDVRDFQRQLANEPPAFGPDKVYADVVDRLLASERYGERWAQHWLDVVRYADTHGFEVNTERKNAWPYRDYVIRAFNNDTPYDRFIKEQIVGDALGEDAATGFLVTASVLLPAQIGKDAPSIRLARQDSLDEVVNNISQTFLGLSVGCARCHDHKFDPITAQDYYAMQAIVAGVEYADRPIRSPDAEARGKLAETLRERLLAEKDDLQARIKAAATSQLVFAGKFRQPDKIHLLLRGDPEQPTAEVLPAVLSALGDIVLSSDTAEQDRRRALADWIASPENCLTARVMVNRIWQGHFGAGLVETPSDLGNNGVPPTHPQLLDWLAAEFIRLAWSIKHMHRLIVLSKTYRQASAYEPRAAEIDADVRWLWRYPSRRLEAESIRDSMLAVSGELNLTMYGPGFNLFDKRGGLSGFKPVETLSSKNQRRMIYAHKVRRETEAVFGAFDCPDAGQSTAVRRASTTPIQALNLFNSRFTLDVSSAFADRIQREAGEDVAKQIDRAYELALNRLPIPAERRDAEPFVRQYGLAVLCRALFNSNEFLFIP